MRTRTLDRMKAARLAAGLLLGALVATPGAEAAPFFGAGAPTAPAGGGGSSIGSFVIGVTPPAIDGETLPGSKPTPCAPAKLVSFTLDAATIDGGQHTYGRVAVEGGCGTLTPLGDGLSLTMRSSDPNVVDVPSRFGWGVGDGGSFRVNTLTTARDHVVRITVTLSQPATRAGEKPPAPQVLHRDLLVKPTLKVHQITLDAGEDNEAFEGESFLGLVELSDVVRAGPATIRLWQKDHNSGFEYDCFEIANLEKDANGHSLLPIEEGSHEALFQVYAKDCTSGSVQMFVRGVRLGESGHDAESNGVKVRDANQQKPVWFDSFSVEDPMFPPPPDGAIVKARACMSGKTKSSVSIKLDSDGPLHVTFPNKRYLKIRAGQSCGDLEFRVGACSGVQGPCEEEISATYTQSGSTVVKYDTLHVPSHPQNYITFAGADLVGHWVSLPKERCRGVGEAQLCRIRGRIAFENTGIADARGFTVIDELRSETGTRAAKKRRMSLRAGQKKTRSVVMKLPRGERCQGCEIAVTIDPRNRIMEQDESNNVVVGPVR